MAITEFRSALNQVADERNIKVEDVIETLKEALIAAYKKDTPGAEEVEDQDLAVDINDETGEIKIVLDGKDVTPAGFGRIASQTAKQVILQKIREAEKKSIAQEYKEKIGTIIQGYVFRVDRDMIVMDLGKTHGIMPPSEQVNGEYYKLNQKYKVLIKEVKEDDAGSHIILSRRDPKFIEALFEQEVHEVAQGVVKIERIAREAGQRTKIAVSSSDPKVDPSGACIGQRGVRVQAVTDELNGEKVDIINYSPDPDKFIAAALSPATVIDVVLNHEDNSASVKVAEDKLSLAIGNKGQNARLAAKLTEWRITINGADLEEMEKMEAPKREIEASEEDKSTKEDKSSKKADDAKVENDKGKA